MTIAPEEIMAFVDGEADEVLRARVEAAMAEDVALAARVKAQSALRQRLRSHFDPIIAEPVPEAWTAMIAAATQEPAARGETPVEAVGARAAEVIDIAEARAARRREQAPARRLGTRAFGGLALAASLALAVFVGLQWHHAPGGAGSNEDLALASPDLARRLDTQLASAQDGAPVRMLGSFRRASGDFCRVFSGAASSGIACKGETGWRIQALMPGGQAQASDYRQAGSTQAELMAMAQKMAAGEPLNAAQEVAARDRGWR